MPLDSKVEALNDAEIDSVLTGMSQSQKDIFFPRPNFRWKSRNLKMLRLRPSATQQPHPFGVLLLSVEVVGSRFKPSFLGTVLALEFGAVIVTLSPTRSP